MKSQTLFGILLVFLGLTAGIQAKDKRPNVLLIVCDDLNTRVSTSGYNEIITPTFERLADAGMTFERAYCQYPVCGPSRASFLSGLYPESTGVITNTVDIRNVRPDAVSMPQAFKESGYWTGVVGKVFHNERTDHGEVAWHEKHFFWNDEMPMVTPIREQFEAEHGPIDSSGKIARKWKEIYKDIAPQTANQKPGYGPTGLKDEQHRDGKNARQVVSWLKDKPNGDKPFFIAVGIHKPHGPYLAPDKYFDMYPTNELTIDPADPAYWDQVTKLAMTKRYEGFDFEFGIENDELRRKYTQAYHACITFIDAQIGLIMDTLIEEGYGDDTIIVLTSDHGYLLGEKFMWGKVFLWDMGTRVPLIIRAPGITKPGSKTDSIAELVDLYPTLAQLCDVKAPSNLQGESLLPILENPKAKVKDYAYTVVRRGKLAKTIVGDRFQYMIWPNGEEELYDLDKDPEELNNLVKSPEYQQQLKTMRKELSKIEAKAKSEATAKSNKVLEET